jgi:hypothetical protein
MGPPWPLSAKAAVTADIVDPKPRSGGASGARGLRLIKDQNVVVFPAVRTSAFSGDGECLAILGYYQRTCQDCLPGLRKAEVDGVRVNSRSGVCVVVGISRLGMGLSIIKLHVHRRYRVALRVDRYDCELAILSLTMEVPSPALRSSVRAGEVRFRKVQLPYPLKRITLRQSDLR